MTCLEALATGSEALRCARSRGIRSREGLAEWLSAQRFPMPPSLGFLNLAILVDANVSAVDIGEFRVQDPPMVRREFRRRRTRRRSSMKTIRNGSKFFLTRWETVPVF